jgi:hypothetical protein
VSSFLSAEDYGELAGVSSIDCDTINKNNNDKQSDTQPEPHQDAMRRYSKAHTIALGSVSRIELDATQYSQLAKLKNNSNDNFITQSNLDSLLTVISYLLGKNRSINCTNTRNGKRNRLVNIPKHDIGVKFLHLSRQKYNLWVEEVLVRRPDQVAKRKRQRDGWQAMLLAITKRRHHLSPTNIILVMVAHK